MDNIRNNSRTLQFIFIKAVLDLYKDATVTMEHSIGKWVFGEIHKKEPLSAEEVNDIKKEIQKLIDKNYPIKRIKVKREEAIKIFQNYGMKDKVKLLQQTSFQVVTLYELDEIRKKEFNKYRVEILDKNTYINRIKDIFFNNIITYIVIYYAIYIYCFVCYYFICKNSKYY